MGVGDGFLMGDGFFRPVSKLLVRLSVSSFHFPLLVTGYVEISESSWETVAETAPWYWFKSACDAGEKGSNMQNTMQKLIDALTNLERCEELDPVPLLLSFPRGTLALLRSSCVLENKEKVMV